MDYVRPFSKLASRDVTIAGGKGASLGEMTGRGISVPPGFVILTTAFEQFIDSAELHNEIESQLAKVNHHEMETIERASEHIRNLIMTAVMPEAIKKTILHDYHELDAPFVAVRSSATAEDGANASWAGELDSFLNTTKETLLENVMRCWASLFTPRAIFYRIEKGFQSSKVSVAVVVQQMVESEVSGIAFSVHPVTEDQNQLIIEAAWGLGEAIVSGSITPDNYVIDKRDWSIIDCYKADQEREIVRKPAGGNEWVVVSETKRSIQKLSDAKLIELAMLVVKIEQHYGFPCDIEWAMVKERLYVLQCRPITTLKEPK